MKKLSNFAFLFAAVTPLAFSAPNHADPEFIAGRIIVEPQAGLGADEFAKDLKIHGAGKARKLGQSNIHVIDVPHGSEKAIANKLKHNPHFKFAELDQLVDVAATSNDPYFGSEWHLNKIGAATAWDRSQGAGVIIAIIDSGVDASHPDLAANMVPGYNTIDNNTNSSDVCGHGTEVAGSAAAALNNALGVVGVAGKAKIMPIRTGYLNSAGSCQGSYSAIAAGITYAADHGARIANASYAYLPSSSAVVSASNYMKSKNGLVFVGAGNSNINEGFTPTDSMIAVSATDTYDAKASFSSYGSFVQLSAPGTNIYTTTRGGGYRMQAGTSFSSPIAAAVGALVMAANPSLTGAQVQNILFSTATDLGTSGRDIYFGYGRVNAAAAVAAAGSSTTVPVTDTTRPTVAIASPGASSTVSGIATVTANASDNVGVTRVELKVNSTVVASDTAAPFSFAWDTKGVINGMATLTAVAYDAAGNVASSSPVSVNVANTTTTQPATDTTAPVVRITNPVAGSVRGNVTVSVNASDNSGSAGISMSLYVDGGVVASGAGSSLSYNWNTNKAARGNHTLQAVARDKAGNTSTSTVYVTR
ncbi:MULTISPECIES: S8 family serine peptidase [unclassified Duganella]|uniref:S8 family serine peptidase n=1 Tax=unclassified Duganella TaxID=2636909 RepID=UPI0006F234F1|nr:MULTISPECIES: S8 family serine peptidase [unclassified Duganella]KQV56444.1 peptidase S8 [Duganella sp. Root336D2]KRB96512.1 peptidase S8 [Duganella sp. Root198D2]